jgi:hypothetical protein
MGDCFAEDVQQHAILQMICIYVWYRETTEPISELFPSCVVTIPLCLWLLSFLVQAMLLHSTAHSPLQYLPE